jgi:two-component system NtrC family sensor kinase
MSIASLKARISFQAKVLVPVVLVMVSLIAVTEWLISRRITVQLEQQAAQQLDTAESIFRKFEAMRTRDLISRFRSLNNEPSYKALLLAEAQTLAAAGDLKTTRLFLEERLREYGASVATCTFQADNSQRFAGAANADASLDVNEFEVRSGPAIRQAFAGQPAVDTISVGRKLLSVVSVPVTVAAREVLGVVTFGVEIGAETTTEIKQIARSEILLLSDGQVAATTLHSPDLYPQLIARFSELSSGLSSTNRAAAHEIELQNQLFLCQAGQFASLSGDSRVGYLLLSDEHGLSELRATQQLLLAVSLTGVVASIAIVWILIRRVTQPLRQLRDTAEAVGRGDFSKRVEVRSNDECGELAVVFNRMTDNLQTSRQELEKTVETLKSTQNQLIQSEKLSGIGEFVAGVAHELNNPLTSVMGFAELLQQSDVPEQHRRYLDVMFKSAKRCQRIVQSLLSFARRHAPERKVVCLNEIVESAIDILAYQMRTSNVEVKIELDPGLPATEVDPHQMQQVFLNIINNARQALEGGEKPGRLHISSESSAGRVRVIFQDNGPGIPPENLKKIFNPFFTTKEVGKGTGLGLSICYGIVTEHGGTITPSSKPGEGARFVIEFPVAVQTPGQIEPAAAPGQPTAAREGQGKRVLVIDDEDTIVQMIKEALTLRGYRVDVALDGESALRRLSQTQYDLALCDWKMPGLGGQQVFERLHAFNPDMSRRLIFITGDVVNEKAQEFLRARNKICLSKPFTLSEFHSAIGRVMVSPGEN